MALQITTIPEIDFGGGIDSQSAPNLIVPGFIEDALNADPKPTGQLAKRKGYQGYGGNFPIRILEVEGITPNTLKFTLSDSIDLSTTGTVPVIIRGRTSVAATGDFSTSDSSHYYPSINTDFRRTIANGTQTLTIDSDVHDIDSNKIWTGVVSSTSEVNNSNMYFYADSISVNQATKQISITTTNGSPDFKAYVYYVDRQTAANANYWSSPISVPASTADYTISVSGGTHNLPVSSLLVKVFVDDSTNYLEVTPNVVEINKSTRDVTVIVDNLASTPVNMVVSISAAPMANYISGSVAANATQTVTADLSPYSDYSNFVFTGVYLDTGIKYEQVVPDSIEVDAQTRELKVTFTNALSSGANFAIFWQFIPLTSNYFTVTGSTSTYIDTNPQMTVWGFDHTEIYKTSVTRGGWVNHIDSYRSQGENRLIAGQGGNLYANRFSDESGNPITYLMANPIYPHLQAQIASDVILGPAFWDTGSTPGRTRGLITGDDSNSHYAPITQIVYNTGTSKVDITLSFPNLQIIDNTGAPNPGYLSTIITTTGIRDRLVIEGASHQIHNGEFDIYAVSAGVNTITFSILNPALDSSDWDVLGGGGEAAVFTDRLTLSSANPVFLLGDKLDTDLFTDDLDITCNNQQGTTLILDHVIDRLALPAGIKVIGRRTSSVLPMRIGSGTSSVANLVRGDMLSYTGFDRQLRILHINPLSNISINIASVPTGGAEAACTLSSGSTNGFRIGQNLLIQSGLYYQGTYQITQIESDTVFYISSVSEAPTDTAILVGNTIQVDEAFEWSDSTINQNYLTVVSRWCPIEAPTDAFDLTKSTYQTYFDALDDGEQEILRSVMVKDSLYFTNFRDEVMKFDGTNLYQAGLPRWQPHLFAAIDTSATGKIDISPITIATSTRTNNIFTITTTDSYALQEGNQIQHSSDLALYTINRIDKQASDTKVYVDRTITGTAGGTLSRVIRFKYYFRLNAVDANSNIVASAVVGSDDFVVELSADAAVRLRLIGFPAWGNFDYERLEVQIYRTKGGSLAPFYRLTTLPLTFNNGSGYVDYVDTASDSDLLALDETSTALEGQELGTTWSEPLRAKTITSAGNKLILGNLRDYPSLNIQLEKVNTNVPQSDWVGKKWTLYRDSADTGTTTDMVNRVIYEGVDTLTAVPISTFTAPNSTTFTVDTTTGGWTVGDWVYLFSKTNVGYDLQFCGWFQVSAVSGTVITLTHIYNGVLPSTLPTHLIYSFNKKDIPIPIGLDNNYQTLNGNNENGVTYEFLAIRRLADAINTSMRQTNITIPGQEAFVPWVIAGAGNDFNSGQLVLRQPKDSEALLAVKLPGFDATKIVSFVNGRKYEPSAKVTSVITRYPSRIIQSYSNFPEMFDNPRALRDIDSKSAIDVNSADGQEITAIIPFFGESAFGAAQQSGTVVVFKTNSIYLVDLNAKDAGQNAVQKIDSQGKGCTAPGSVSVTKSGIMFVNETGIYRLNKSLTVEYLGRKYEGKFRTTADLTKIALAAGHHDAINNVYKLSYQAKDEDRNDKVAVYNHVREYEARNGTDGSWTHYDNHPAIGWANLIAESFFASTMGRVFSLRNTNTVSDYRDDSSAVNFIATLRATNFGDSGRRKVLRGIITHYKGENSIGTTLQVARDLIDNFDQTDVFEIKSNQDSSGLDDVGAWKINSIMSSVYDAKGIYFQLKYANNAIDEYLEITAIDYKVAGISDKGILQAKQTKE